MITEFIGAVQVVNPWIVLAIILIPFFATLIVVPWIVIRIPPDYFNKPEHRPRLVKGRFAPVYLLLVILKNVIGIIILFFGLFMLVLPGQGVLTMLIGMLLLNFPGKYKCERWFVSRKPVLRSINWLRRKRSRPELQIKELVKELAE
ncbi:MAG: hypothetical protein P8M72_10235 [Gammaproteobacteria bacterium]|nr:hypothetical protein [Gammaproteobacteria bacterium]